jgi:hypothetical protein
MSEIVQFPQRQKPAPAPIDTAFLDGMAARKCAQIEAAAYAVAALAATPAQKAKARAIARLAASLAAEFSNDQPPGGAAA